MGGEEAGVAEVETSFDIGREGSASEVMDDGPLYSSDTIMKCKISSILIE